MLPIVDKLTFQFIVEEAKASGIEEILVVTGKAKGKHGLLKLGKETIDIHLHFIRQSHPLGLGHAVLQSKAFVCNEPLVVMLGDDII